MDNNAVVRVVNGHATIESIGGIPMEQCKHCRCVRRSDSFASIEDIRKWETDCVSKPAIGEIASAHA